METRKLQRIALVTGSSGLGLAAALSRQMQAEPLMQLAPAGQKPTKPDDAPTVPLNWRENESRMTEAKAASPLPTRQLKRMAARALARGLSQAQKIEGRQEKLMTRKRQRALEAAARKMGVTVAELQQAGRDGS